MTLAAPAKKNRSINPRAQAISAHHVTMQPGCDQAASRKKREGS